MGKNVFKKLFFDEALFNTIALHTNLIIETIPELENIVYRKKGRWQKHEININNLYHPVKNIEYQYKLRH